jgi:tripartite ATP-independent transporter DctM subunit
MSVGLNAALLFASVAGLLAIGVPMAFALAAASAAFAILLFGWDSLLLIYSRTFGLVNNFVLVSVPMFLMMASIMERAGVARDLYSAMAVWAGRTPGGVGLMTLVAAVFMAATTGVIGGEIILLGLVALPQMLRLNYDRRLAAGIICAGGSLGTMIPPSIVLVFYGLAANVPVGELFMASVMPGLLLAGLYMAYTFTRCILDPSLGPPLPAAERDIPLGEKLALLKGLVLPVGIGLSVLASIYTGVAAVSEAAAVGVAGAMLAAWLRGELSWAMLGEVVRQTMASCGQILWLTFGATALIGVFNLMGGIKLVSDLMTGLPLAPIGIILLMMLILIVLGCFIDWIGILLLTSPIFVPIIVKLGYDPIWYGVLFCMNMQVAYLSPPFGLAAFYLKSVAPPDMTLAEIFSAVWPFIILQIVALCLVVAIPDIALWLPRFLDSLR